MKSLLANKRKEKQDLLNKKINSERELQVKEKEDDILLQEKLNNRNQKINDLKVNLAYDLSKANEATQTEYLDDEKKLLDCDEIQNIIEIKRKINECRLKGLLFDLNAKKATCLDIENIELKSIKEIEDTRLEFSKQNNTKYLSLNKLIYRIDTLELELCEKESEYDLEERIKFKQTLFENTRTFFELAKKQNLLFTKNQVDMTKDDKILAFDFIILPYYYLLIKLKNNNQYDELIVIIEEIIKQIKTNKMKVIDCYSKLELSLENRSKQLCEALKDYVPKDVKETHDSFLNNVTTSLKRFYNNLYIQIEKYFIEYFSLMNQLYTKIISLHNKIVNDNNLKELEVNYLPEQYILKKIKYDYIKLDYYEVTDVEFIKDNEKDIPYLEYPNILNNNIEMKLQEITRKYNSDLRSLDKKVKANKRKYVRLNKNLEITYISKEKFLEDNLQRFMLIYNKNILKYTKESKKNTRKKLSSAKSVYNRLHKQLDK